MKFFNTKHSAERIQERFRSEEEANKHFEEVIIELKKKRLHSKKGIPKLISGKLVDTFIVEHKGATFVYAKMNGFFILITAYMWYTKGEMRVKNAIAKSNQ